MQRKKFIKTLALGGLGISILPQLSFQIQEEYTLSQLIGKGNPDIIGTSYTSKMHREAKKAFLKMKTEAQKEHIKIEVVSAYRSFERQKQIFENKYSKYIHQGLTPTKAIAKIIEYSTIPGTSRHHWGTDLDLIDAQVPKPKSVLQAPHFHGNGVFCKFKQWMNTNAHRFGFYLVYTDKPTRKGFKYEPWHYSYAPVSKPMLNAYRKLNLKEILQNEKITGSNYFTDSFIEKYRKENILDINPKLL
ncbi:MAG: M15 family metallopeptidase [Flavobacteriales bacterium]